MQTISDELSSCLLIANPYMWGRPDKYSKGQGRPPERALIAVVSEHKASRMKWSKVYANNPFLNNEQMPEKLWEFDGLSLARCLDKQERLNTESQSKPYL